MSKAPSSSESNPTEITEAQKVIDFKLVWLLQAGFSVSNAERIANRSDVDWHLAVDMLPRARDKGYDDTFVTEFLL